LCNLYRGARAEDAFYTGTTEACSLVHGFYPATVYPEDGPLSYAAVERLPETGGGDRRAQILAGD